MPDNCENHEFKQSQTEGRGAKEKNKRISRGKYKCPAVKSPQHCEYKECINDVISICFGCSCFLCSDHLNYENCTGHDKMINSLSNDENSDDSNGENGMIKRGRKRFKKENNWKSNERKRMRNRGDSYISTNKKIRIGREVGEPCTQCKFNCSEKICYSQRQGICKEYWDLGELDRQRIYINSRVGKI